MTVALAPPLGLTLGLARVGQTAGRTGDEHAITSRTHSRRRHARDGRRTRLQLAEAGELMDVVNHELRTPLTTIIGFTEMLRTGDAGVLTDEQNLMLDRVNAGAEQLQCLVEALLGSAMSELQGSGAADVVQIIRNVVRDRPEGTCCS